MQPPLAWGNGLACKLAIPFLVDSRLDLLAGLRGRSRLSSATSIGWLAPPLHHPRVYYFYFKFFWAAEEARVTFTVFCRKRHKTIERAATNFAA